MEIQKGGGGGGGGCHSFRVWMELKRILEFLIRQDEVKNYASHLCLGIDIPWNHPFFLQIKFKRNAAPQNNNAVVFYSHLRN